MREGMPLGTRFTDAVDRLVLYLERNRLSIIGVFLYVLMIALVRDISEYYLLDRAFVTDPHPWIYSIAHHVAFYFLTFFGLVFLISAFSRRGVRKAVNYVSMFFWVIVLPPFLDRFLFGSQTNYAYFSPTDFLNYLLNFSGPTFHPGQAIEIVVALFAVVAYVAWTKRASFGTVSGRAMIVVEVALLLLFTLMSLFIMATPGAYLPVGNEGGIPTFPGFEVTRYFQFHLFIFAYYMVLLLGILASLAYLHAPRAFRGLVLSMRPAQTVMFAGIVAAGIALGWSSFAGNEYIYNILDRPYWVNLSFVILSILSAMLAWLVTTMWNDLADHRDDSPERAGRTLASGTVGRRDLAEMSVVLMSMSLIMGALLSWTHVALLGTIFLLGAVYSFRPVRFKDRLLSPLLLGAGAFLAFIYGFMTPLSPMVLYQGDPGLVLPGSWELLFPTPTAQAVLIGLYMFLGLVVGSMVTDIDGYEEDRRGGVETAYTKFGTDGGRKIVSVLVLLASFTPLALFQDLGDIIIFPVLGVAASLVFLRTGRSGYVLLIALAGMTYAAWRFLPALS
ncbi:MAG: UbiA family prenyltransferase [Methanomassiliicoccus sp.]|nr:UbiA family prenyltransferase [Methanomassiliicoccus sp.]